MEDKIEIRGDYWWPKEDKSCWRYLSKRSKVPEIFSSYVTNKRVVVQAGGNAGMYPHLYSTFFETVYTIEPDPTNFYCLVKNTGDNVFKYQACLGNERKTVNLSYDTMSPKKPNYGGFFVNGIGNIPTIRIDDLGLPVCDFIHLDIEGFEGEALLGGLNTINKFKPLIGLELKDHGEKFGWPETKILDLLKDLGYNIKNNDIYGDALFEYQN